MAQHLGWLVAPTTAGSQAPDLRRRGNPIPPQTHQPVISSNRIATLASFGPYHLRANA